MSLELTLLMKNLNIDWKVKDPIISEKDISSPNFDKNQHYNF